MKPSINIVKICIKPSINISYQMEETNVPLDHAANASHSRNESILTEDILDEQTDLDMAAAIQSLAKETFTKRSSITEVKPIDSSFSDQSNANSQRSSRRSSTMHIPPPAIIQRNDSDVTAVGVLGSVAEAVGLAEIKRAPPLPSGPPPPSSSASSSAIGITDSSTSSIPRPTMPPSDPVMKPKIEKSFSNIANVQQSSFPLASNKPKIEKQVAILPSQQQSSNFHIPAAAKQVPVDGKDTDPATSSSSVSGPSILPPPGPKPKPAIMKSIPGPVAASIPKPAGPPPPTR
jgi:hypothetical protein